MVEFTDVEKAEMVRHLACVQLVESGILPALIEKVGSVESWMLTPAEIIEASRQPRECNHVRTPQGIFGKCQFCEVAGFLEKLFTKLAIQMGAPPDIGLKISKEQTIKEEKRRHLVA